MRGPHGRRRCAVAAVLLAIASSARAEPDLRPRYELVPDAAVTGSVGAVTLSLLLLENELAPARCRWCEPSGFEANLTSSLRWSRPRSAATASDVLAVALTGAALAYPIYDGHRRGDREVGWANALLITEATSVAVFLDTATKYAVGRQRPYAWRGETLPGDGRSRNLSFFSGHATFAFALAASSSTLLLEQRAPHARTYAWLAFGAAGAVSYLRVAADRHYPSDVLVGAAVGTVVGWAIPHFFHAPSQSGLQLAPAPGGISLVW